MMPGYNKKTATKRFLYDDQGDSSGARGGNRTRTPLRAQHFKCCVATNYTTRASLLQIIQLH